MPETASLRVIVDQTAKIHRLYRLGAGCPERNQEKQELALKPLKQLVMEVVVISQAQAAGRSLKALVGAKSVNAKDVAH